jgi:hypothetical protein
MELTDAQIQRIADRLRPFVTGEMDVPPETAPDAPPPERRERTSRRTAA